MSPPPRDHTEAPAEGDKPGRDQFREGIRKTKAKQIPQRSLTREPGCEVCGSKGWRHKKGCDAARPAPKKQGRPIAQLELSEDDEENDDLPPPPKPERDEPLTEDQWEQVKDMRDSDDLSSLQICDRLGVPLQQVNYAILAQTYESYLRNANRAA